MIDDGVSRLRELVPAGGTVVLETSTARTVGLALAAWEGHLAEVHLVGDAAVVEGRAGVPVVRDADLPPTTTPPEVLTVGHRDQDRPTAWVLYSSGTTGTPTPTHHTLSTLTRTARSRASSLTWGLVYEPTRMAGIQVILQAMRSGARIVDASSEPDLATRLRRLVEGGVTALSATPTLWRQILQSPAADGLALQQVTLGGEIADQTVLDAVTRAYPGAQVTHVFASTETGAAFSVRDGDAGFPRSYLDEPPGGIRLQVRDGMLLVHNPTLPSAPQDGFVSTGDLVEVVGDRVVFRGRSSGVANVGGVKVWPEHVESVLRAHPLVAEALVTVRDNPMSGTILTAAVVARDGGSTVGLSRELRRHCAAHLPRAGVPAVIRVVDLLSVTTNGKLSRR